MEIQTLEGLKKEWLIDEKQQRYQILIHLDEDLSEWKDTDNIINKWDVCVRLEAHDGYTYYLVWNDIKHPDIIRTDKEFQ